MKKSSLSSLIFALTVFLSCETNFSSKLEKSLEPVPPYVPTVYTSGSFYDSDKHKPCFWKGTSRTDLPMHSGGVSGQTNGIYVYGDKVITAGYTDDASMNSISAFWVDNQRIELPSGGNGNLSRANSVWVDEGIVYTAGEFLELSDFESKPCYWVGTARHILDKGTGAGGRAAAITRSDSITYIGGNTGDYPYDTDVVYWKDGTRTVPGSAGFINAIYVDNGIIYTAGSSGGSVCYWKNSSKTVVAALPSGFTEDSQSATGISLSGSDVIISGYYTFKTNESSPASIIVPCIWINNALNKIDLPVGSDLSKNGKATGVAVFNNIAYVSGYYSDGTKDIPCYWTVTLDENKTVTKVILNENGGRALGIALK